MINVNIQLLRGVSVLLVLLFHLDVDVFKFGYIGVDIFFLISGFLMPIILPKYDAWGFIKARIRRLLPALSAVVFTTLVLGYFLQLPGEYLSLANSSLSSFAFLSQFYFMFNTGYFDQESIFQPLLHTWSLGNEFLAYIAVFISLLLLSKEKLKSFSLVMVFLSGIYTFYMMTFSSINYLDPIPRIFLFFIAFYVSYNRADIKISDKKLAVVSFISLLLICVFFGEQILLKSWPNYSILFFPSLILPLMLMDKNITPFFVLNKTLKKFGDWSYSIYIWHWPVIAFERIYLRNAYISNKEVLFLFVVSVVVGVFSYYFIERRKHIGIIGLVLSLIFSIGIYITNGASYRTPESLSNYSSVERMTDNKYYLSVEKVQGIDVFKVANGEVKGTTVLIGDSHSRHMLPIYKSGYKSDIFRISLQPSELIENWREVNTILESLGADKIIFAYRFDKKNEKEVELLVEKISFPNFTNKYEVSIIRDIPSFDGDPISCLFANESDLLFKGCGFDIKHGIPVSEVMNRDSSIWKIVFNNSSNKIRLIDTHNKMCNLDTCITMVEGEFIMRDSNHFNEKMSHTANFYLYELLFEYR